MKDIISKINEGKYCQLFSEVQNGVEKNAEYHTYNITDGQKKFKKGFIYINSDEDFFGIQAFNKSKDLANVLGTEDDYYNKLDSIAIGASEKIDGSQYIRIW